MELKINEVIVNSSDILLTEIANPNRIEILQILAKSPNTFTELTKILDISSSEISRHLNRLTDQKIIEKQHPSRYFQLTSLGQLIIQLISPLNFILKHVDYFENHIFTDLPIDLIKNLDALQNCEIVQGTGLVMIKMEETMKSAKKSTDVMVETPFPWGTANMHVRYIVPSSLSAMRKNVEKFNATTDGRFLDRVPITMLIIDDGGGLLFFPDLKGKTDFNTGFLISQTDSVGCSFLRKIWNHFWTLGKIQP
jgi:DNA-binding transcriptional ArsR family regulator